MAENLHRFAEAVEEPVVLLAGPIADADMAGSAERRAWPDDYALTAECLDDPGLGIRVLERDPGEVGVRVGCRQAKLADAFLDVDTLDDLWVAIRMGVGPHTAALRGVLPARSA